MNHLDDSFKRVLDRGALDRFYEHFRASDARIDRHLADVNWDEQRWIFAQFISALIDVVERGENSPAYMARLTNNCREDGEFPISPEMYDDWLESMIKSLCELDPDFSSELEAIWRETL